VTAVGGQKRRRFGTKCDKALSVFIDTLVFTEMATQVTGFHISFIR
jgi:hypothetical protein